MRISTYLRHLREGARNVIRNGWMTFASISAIAVSLLILGIFLLLTLNVNFLAKQIESQVEIKVYLEVNTPSDMRVKIENEIRNLPGISSLKFVSKEEGLVFLREKLGESGKALLEGFEGDNNPLNDSFTIEVLEPQKVGEVATAIEKLNDNSLTKPINKVSYGKGTVEKLFQVTKIVRNLGLILVVCLALTAMFLIANTIKITIMTRRKEISIMKMVGATNRFIRWPFFVEGALLGIIGSMVPVVVLLYGYWQLLQTAQLDLNLLMIKLLPYEEVSVTLSTLLIGIGIGIGVFGSLLSVSKYLRV